MKNIMIFQIRININDSILQKIAKICEFCMSA